ncbi:sodium phosphate cotransporter, Na/Pi cotransport system protein [Thalassiosira pseudonana CCMP1335]|jgi:sodium-dependent phosphate cotransporter|uniref:Sodium phosphate cotransporter, Na/Pi cotransport system protein n=1 Tax=Thalassiosira pseudonana TaxID=35128 RepID=B8CA16_THAPS|nr:sodium phosphate cotransporter, Na/Pi cotransport system protein [Thalassiosira pseudonana CCMP1335]EED89425.1 sodium phosphate cotransporter, Na/Pi cotransport system protein [Thalassiosira pseudonana CCMP1335]|eukprot:g11425.t1 g11425   contig5:811127-813336(-)
MADVEKQAQAAEAKSRKDRPTGSIHFGDPGYDEAVDHPEEIGDATWSEVCTACCVHDAEGWGKIFVGACAAVFFLYFFLFALELLGNSAKVLGGCSAGGLMGDDTNPVAGLVIGELATALVQSSSTTTSIIVSLVGAEAVSVKSGIYMVMGANIGTSVTNTIVSMGQMADGAQLERAFAGATVHDLFNLLSVAVLFPLEVISHYLYYLTKAMLPSSVADGESWSGPIKQIVSPLAGRVLKANKNVIKDIATKKVESCDDYYPVACIDGIEDYKHCTTKCEDGDIPGETCGRVGTITCDKKTGCPAFFQNGATKKDDDISGGVCLVLSLALLIVCLIGLVNVLQRGLMGMSTRIIYKATNVNGLIAILIGAAITVLVQSSSITTSVLTPLVGVGCIQLEQMLPLTLGANIGTTVTGLLAAMVSDNVEALQVALCHFFFNISGIIIWYPLPFMRKVPLNGARALGRATRRSKLVPPIYIIIVFFVIPLVLLGISALFEQKTVGFTVLGSFVVIGVVLGIARFVWWWKKQDGHQACLDCLDKRTAMNECKATLPEDMKFLKQKVARLSEHTGLPEDEEEAEELLEKPNNASEDTEPAAVAVEEEDEEA